MNYPAEYKRAKNKALKKDYSLYYKAQDADEKWGELLRKEYGNKASDYRYTAKGYATPALKRAKNAKLKADENWRKEMLKENPVKKHSPKQIAATKKLVALNKAKAKKKTTVKKKRVVSKRVGTSQTKRSMITKKPPSKRLKARRGENTKKGYYPNPTKARYHLIIKPNKRGVKAGIDPKIVGYWDGQGFDDNPDKAVLYPSPQSVSYGKVFHVPKKVRDNPLYDLFHRRAV